MNPEDKKLLTALQSELPLVSRPFFELAKKLDRPEHEVLDKIKKFISEQRITRIGAVFNSNKLGYRSTLVAMKVPYLELSRVVPIINRLKGVSHNYLREGEYNLWFTLGASSDSALSKTINLLKQKIHFKSLLNLKSRRVFKIDTSFSSQPKKIKSREVSKTFRPRGKEKRLINRLSYSIPLVSAPFKKIGNEFGLEEQGVLNRISDWLEQGIIRRFSALVKPTRIGLEGAALGVWKVKSKKVDSVGNLMAEFPQVSHCYQRITRPGWRYNLYTMIHGDDKKECLQIAKKISEKTGVSDYKLLFTLKELKKESMHYFEE